jgi:predicted rRNA methylase
MKMEVIYGKNSVNEFLKTSGRQLSGRLLIARGQEAGPGKQIVDLATRLGLVCLSGPRKELDQMYPGVNHQGFVLELGKPRAERDAQRKPDSSKQPALGRKARGKNEEVEEDTDSILLPPLSDEIMSWDWEKELPAAVERGERPRVLVLDRVQDPGNLGAIVRSAAQFGAACIFIPKDGASGMTPAARKTACGGDCYVPVVAETNLVRVLEKLKEMGFWTAAAVGSEGKDVREFDFDTPFAVVLGSEGEGIRRLLAERCDWKLSIQTLPRLDSLNVSVSAGIILHEMFSKRKILK